MDVMKKRSDEQIVALANALARELYGIMGYNVPETYLFYTARHPQEVMCWRMAAKAFEMLASTDVDEALAAIDDE